jgi:hypothetical protein
MTPPAEQLVCFTRTGPSSSTRNYQQTITRRPQLATALTGQILPRGTGPPNPEIQAGLNSSRQQKEGEPPRTTGPPPEHLSNPPTPPTAPHTRKICQPPQLSPRNDQIPGAALRGTNYLGPTMTHTRPNGQDTQWLTQNMNPKKCTKLVSWAGHSSPADTRPHPHCLHPSCLERRKPHGLPQMGRDLPLQLQTPGHHSQKGLQIHPPETNTMGQDATTAGHPEWDINLLLVGNTQGFTQAFGPNPDTTTANLKKDLIRDINAHTQPKPPLTWSQLTHHWPIGPHTTNQATPHKDSLLYRPNTKVSAAPADTTQNWALHPQHQQDPTQTSELPISNHPEIRLDQHGLH